MLENYWESAFSGQILSRGLKYYRTGRVEYYNDIEKKRVEADVTGSELYSVTIDYAQKGKMRPSCDCPYAEGGGLCKHIAAVLYAMQEDRFDYAGAAGETGENRRAPGRLLNDYRYGGSSSGSNGKNSAASDSSGNIVRMKDKIVYPFSDNKAGNSLEEYQYFNFAALTKDLKIRESQTREADKLCKSGRMADEFDFEYYSDPTGSLSGSVLEVETYIRKSSEEIAREKQMYKSRGSAYRYYLSSTVNEDFEVHVKFNREKFLALSCSCPACRDKRGLQPKQYYYTSNIDSEICEHIVAVLYQVDRFIREKHPGDASDYMAARLLQNFAMISHGSGKGGEEAEQQAERRKNDISLVPQLQEDYHGLRAFFRIGSDKMYMLKNRFELVRAVEQDEKMILGKASELDFAHETFKDDDSARLYDMLAASVNEDIARGMAYSYDDGTVSEFKSSILLMGHNLDEFFDLCEGMKIERKGASKKSEGIELKYYTPRLQLSIDPIYSKDKLFHGVKLTGTLPRMEKGARYSYLFTENSICRVSTDFARTIKLLPKRGDTELDISIGRKNLASFYRTIYPELLKFADISDNCKENIDEYLPPEAAFKFLLDVKNKMPVCEIKSVYGDTEFNALECLSPYNSLTFLRDENRERNVVNNIRRFFGEYDEAAKQLMCNDESEVYELLNSGIPEMQALGEINVTDAFKRLSIRPRPRINVGVSAKSDMLELTIESEDVSREELLQILNSYKLKKKYYRLKNGDFMRLEDDSLEELSAVVEAMHLSPKEFVKGNMKLPLYRALYLDKMLEQNSSFYSERDKNFRNLVKEFKTVNESDYEVPAELEKVLRNYQIFGYKWLRTVESCHFGGILADDMGLGKTIQVISLLMDAKQRSTSECKPGETALIVSPASLVYNWKAEFERFAPNLKVCTVTGTQAERAQIIENATDWDALITSYDLLKRDIAEYGNIEFAYEILDEAQYIKNHNTAAAKAVKVVRACQRFALTGTPIENRLSELWSIFDYLMPGFLYGYDVFRKEFETPIAKNSDDKRLEQLKRMVSPFILRRLKKDVLMDIPDKLEEVYYAKLEGDQRKVYDAEVTKIRHLLEKTSDAEFGKGKLEVLAELTRIRQICCDPHLLFDNYTGASAKKETCLELIKSALEGEHRILLFSQFTSMLEILENALSEEGIGYYKITGQTSKETRMELVNAFNDGKDGVNVFLISLKAGGTGLNLTGADIVIHFDPWWNVAAQNQATDRAHRIGQTKVVSVYKLIAKDTIEEKIQKMQEDKKNLADSILTGEMGGLAQMTREEIMDLLGAK